MRLKGISTFEQHVEKIVLVVMVAVLLAVVSLQFLTQPNLIDTGGAKIPPGEVLSQLQPEVNRLRAAVEDKEPPLPEIVTPNLVTNLDEALEPGSTLPERLEVAFGPGADIGGDDSIGPVADGPIMAMTIAEPMSPTAYSSWVTADPYAVEEIPDLAAYLPAEQPFDTPGISVETVIDGALTQQLLREGVEGNRPIPATWWRGGVAVLEVIAERQELGPDGQWSPASPVGAFPGAFDLMEGFDEAPSPSELRDVIVPRAQEAAEAIVRPAYIPQIAGPEWVSPTEALERDAQYANMSDVDLLRAKRRSLLDAIARHERQLTERPDRDPGRTRDPGGGGGNRIGPDPTGRNTRDTGDADRLREERRVANIQRQLDTKRKQVTEIEAELASLGFPVAADDRTAEPEPATTPDPNQGRFLGNAQYKVWAHDLDVVPGAVYRYRMRVKVNNPIFGKDRSLDPKLDKLELAKEPYAFSEWSGWSEPVMVGRESYLFLNNAEEARRMQQANRIGGGSARVSAEVFTMYYGHYRRGTVSLEPGDAAAAEVRVPERLYLFDTALVSREVAHSLLGVVPEERERFAPPLPGREPGRPSEEIINIQPDPRQPITDDERRRNRPVAEPEVPIELPDGVTESPTRIAVEMDRILLEVVQLPIGETGADGEQALYYVYFETEGGEIEHRRPDLDRETEAYELVRASYLLGQATGTEDEE